MGWFPNILHGLQSTNPTKMMHILPTKDMPYCLENPKYAEIISEHVNTRYFQSEIITNTEKMSYMNLGKKKLTFQFYQYFKSLNPHFLN
jgi:hypothetical protein